MRSDWETMQRGGMPPVPLGRIDDEPMYGQNHAEPFDPGPEDNPTVTDTTAPTTSKDADDGRRIVLTRADTFRIRPVRWLWTGRVARGTLALLAGQAGLGKSTLAYWMAAQITRGDLPGDFEGTPKTVLVAATEDSWEYTIAPRLTAHRADMTRVFRVEVMVDEIEIGLTLPRDVTGIEQAVSHEDAALLILDPLMSRLGKLDSHKDAEVRQALEPLVAVADRANIAVLGLMHHNKGGGSDPMQSLMASVAFGAVARSVHTVVIDPDDDNGERRLFGTVKNNLGRLDMPTLGFTVASHGIDTDEGVAWTGRIEWGDEQTGSIADAMRRSSGSDEDKSATGEATEWLLDLMVENGGQMPAADAKREGAKAGYTDKVLRRARLRLRIESVKSRDFTGGGWFWEMPKVPCNLPVPDSWAPSTPSSSDDAPRNTEDSQDALMSVSPTSGAPSRGAFDAGPHSEAVCASCGQRKGSTIDASGVCASCRRVAAANAAACHERGAS